MRTKQFDVPADTIVEFAEILEENEMRNSILGVNGEGEIQVEVEYDREERSGILELMELMDDEDEETE
jgi:adenosine/AMP kinase